jgi:hypothetical protein
LVLPLALAFAVGLYPLLLCPPPPSSSFVWHKQIPKGRKEGEEGGSRKERKERKERTECCRPISKSLIFNMTTYKQIPRRRKERKAEGGTRKEEGGRNGRRNLEALGEGGCFGLSLGRWWGFESWPFGMGCRATDTPSVARLPVPGATRTKPRRCLWWVAHAL